MGKHLYAQVRDVSSGFAEKSDGNPFGDSDRLNVMPRRRQPIKEILLAKMRGANLSVTDLVRRSGNSVPKSTITDIVNGETTNPRIFTLEAIAVAMDESPEQLIADILGSRSDDPAFKGSQFAILLEIYKSLPAPQREKADTHIEGLLFQLERLKNQPK